MNPKKGGEREKRGSMDCIRIATLQRRWALNEEGFSSMTTRLELSKGPKGERRREERKETFGPNQDCNFGREVGPLFNLGVIL